MSDSSGANTEEGHEYGDPIDAGDGWKVQVMDTSRGTIGLEVSGHGMSIILDIPATESFSQDCAEAKNRLDWRRGREAAIRA